MIVVEEEEELVPDDRAADRTAKLVEVDDRLGRIRAEGVIVRVQSCVLEILVCRTVEAIGAALADLVVENAAHAVLRIEKAELLVCTS